MFSAGHPRLHENFADVLSIFARSSSAVTASEKSSVNTNRRSTIVELQQFYHLWLIAPRPVKFNP